MAGWTYGGTATNPSVSGNTGNGSVTYSYKAAGASSFNSTKPTNAGTHTVKATIAESANYLGGEATNTYTVAKANLSVTAPTAASLTYNRNNQNLLATNGSATGGTFYYKVGSGSWGTSLPQGKNADTYTVSYYVKGDANHNDAGSTSSPKGSVSCTIGKKAVTVSGITASDKTYDGNTTATIVTTNASFAEIISGDALTVTTTGTFNNKNVGDGKTVTFGTLTLGGTSVGNYKLASSGNQATTTANITRKGVTVTPNNGQSKTYGATDPTLTYTVTGLVGSENLTGTLSRNSGENVGNYSITQGTVTNANNGNYSITFTTGKIFTIGTKALTVTANAKAITYGEAPDNAGVTYNGFVNGETETDLGGGLEYAYSYTQYGNVGNYTITPSGLNSTNYAISYLPGTLTVNQKLITVSGITANNKVYDKSTTATLDYTSSVLSGKVGSDDLSVSATGTFADCNVDNGISVSISGLTLGGTKVGNYDLAASGHQTSTTANITPKEVGINWGVTLLTYTGNPQAPVATATGLVGDDVCNVNVTGQQTDVGVYTGDAAATASSLSNANYKLPTTGLTTPFEIADGMSISFADGQQWATWYSDHDYLVPPGTTAYVVSDVNESTGAVTADAVTYVPKNVGVLVYRTATVADNITSDVYTGDTDASITSCLRNGAPTPYKDYILYNNGFVLSSVSTIGIHNCYLPGSAAAGARALFITIGDETTSLSFETTDDADSDRWYDMQGRRIEKPLKKGLYIRNGKKVVVK